MGDEQGDQLPFIRYDKTECQWLFYRVLARSTSAVGKFFKIPCMRTSLLTGLSGGLGVALVHFMFTSNARRSGHYGFGSYVVLTLGTWGYCRYQWEKEEIQIRQFRKALHQRLLTEGTDLEKKIEEQAKSV